MPIKRRITVDWPAMMAAFSARLRETRETRRMTRKELAQHLNVAPGTIWNWENSYS
jgi:transcriptional regulator with XRE-family HTH domain